MADTEVKLWNFIKPGLLGSWHRLEVTTANGIPDAMGMYAGSAHFVELKVGPPSIKALRPPQFDFFCEALRQGVSVWVLFRHRGILKWYAGLPVGDPSPPPRFYRAAPSR